MRKIFEERGYPGKVIHVLAFFRDIEEFFVLPIGRYPILQQSSQQAGPSFLSKLQRLPKNLKVLGVQTGKEFQINIDFSAADHLGFGHLFPS
ncbi:MAG: hypothetical protein WA974_03855 [Thermodesulfobacteriota bacterium]